MLISKQLPSLMYFDIMVEIFFNRTGDASLAMQTYSLTCVHTSQHTSKGNGNFMPQVRQGCPLLGVYRSNILATKIAADTYRAAFQMDETPTNTRAEKKDN